MIVPGPTGVTRKENIDLKIPLLLPVTTTSTSFLLKRMEKAISRRKTRGVL